MNLKQIRENITHKWGNPTFKCNICREELQFPSSEISAIENKEEYLKSLQEHECFKNG